MIIWEMLQQQQRRTSEDTNERLGKKNGTRTRGETSVGA